MIKYSVEYMINNESNVNNVTFITLDEAISFINEMRESFKDCLEWIFIHCIKVM